MWNDLGKYKHLKVFHQKKWSQACFLELIYNLLIFISQLTGIWLGRQLYAICFHTTISVPTSPFYNTDSKITVIYVGTRIFFQFKPARSYLSSAKIRQISCFLDFSQKATMLEDNNQKDKTFFLDLFAKWGTMHSPQVWNTGQAFMRYSTYIHLLLCLSLHTCYTAISKSTENVSICRRNSMCSCSIPS